MTVGSSVYIQAYSDQDWEDRFHKKQRQHIVPLRQSSFQKWLH